MEKVGQLFARRRELEREMVSLSQNEQERLRTIDLLSFQAQELERAQLEPGEDACLEDEKRIVRYKICLILFLTLCIPHRTKNVRIRNLRR